MHKTTLLALGASAITLIGAGPAAAQDPQGEWPSPQRGVTAGPYPQATFEGSNGYEFFIDGGTTTTILTASKGPLEAGWRGPSANNSEHMEFDFNDSVVVDVDFEPEGRKRKAELPPECTGTPHKIQKGTWVGTVEIETSYSTVSETKVPGELIYPGQVTCNFPPEGAFVVLTGNRTGDGGTSSTSFSAVSADNRKRAIYSSSRYFGEGDIQRYLSNETAGPKSGFLFDLESSAASVTPPKPFSGFGSFVDVAWGGSLTSKVPGDVLDLGHFDSKTLARFEAPAA